MSRRYRQRGVTDNQRIRRLPGTFAVVTPSVNANKFRLTFDVPVVLRGVPADITVQGQPPLAATQVSQTVIDLAYAVNVAAGQAYIIPPTVNAIRGYDGGFIAAKAGTF